jgi:hypothetical protein
MSLSPEQQEQYIAIWAKAVDTQMHFNEMSVKSRQLGLTFIAAALGVGIVLLSRGEGFSYEFAMGQYKLQLHITVFLVLGAWLAIVAVRRLDLDVYHKMLRGAVTFGEDFEEHYMKRIFKLEKGMTQAISHFSRYSDASKKVGSDGKYKYQGRNPISAEEKIRNFYKNTVRFLWLAAFAFLIVTNLSGISKLVSNYVTVTPPTATNDKDQTKKDAAKSEEKAKH